MIRAGVALAIAAALASPAASASLFSYNWTSDAKLISDDGRAFTVYVHPHQDVILLEPRMVEITRSLAGADMPGKWPINVWRHAAELWVAPVGCGISDIHAAWGKSAGAWEAAFVCPPGIDLRRLAHEQHSALMAGAPLHP
ncbi:MAG: hypothetical protein ACHP7N_00280 [Caulobacterales bacterium]